MEQANILTAEAMRRGGRYNWKGQPDRLIYLRRFNGWHQFKKIGDPRDVWCEVLDADLHMLEETPRDVNAEDDYWQRLERSGER